MFGYLKNPQNQLRIISEKEKTALKLLYLSNLIFTDDKKTQKRPKGLLFEKIN